VKRSILEQDLDIEDVRLVTTDDVVVVDRVRSDTIYRYETECEWITTNSSWNPCVISSEVTTEWQEEVVLGQYQVIVTPKETYDVPEKTVCYDEGWRYVCESTLRCDGVAPVEYGCEHVVIAKFPGEKGGVLSANIGRAPIRDLVTRKEVLLNPSFINDAGLTKRLPIELVDSVKASYPVEEVATE
jgi:hypothetical protein